MIDASDHQVAQRMIAQVWPAATVEPLLESENATFRVRGGERPAVLRLHRPGYQNDAAIVSELDWIEALRADTDVDLVEPLRTDAGRILTDAATYRRAVMFAEVPGGPVADGDLDAAHFAALGAIAATFHGHAQGWSRPPGFARFSWDVDDTIGRRPRWGDWRLGLGVTARHRDAIAPAATRAAARIDAFGRTADRYGLIHGDLRAANLIAHAAGGFTVIDFDDSGFGWHLFEFAAAASFVETDPRLGEWAHAWTAAYRARRALPDEHEELLADFVLLRRLQLLGWLGTHGHAIEADPEFADDTVAVAQRYLSGSLV